MNVRRLMLIEFRNFVLRCKMAMYGFIKFSGHDTCVEDLETFVEKFLDIQMKCGKWK